MIESIGPVMVQVWFRVHLRTVFEIIKPFFTKKSRSVEFKTEPGAAAIEYFGNQVFNQIFHRVIG